MPVPHIDDIDHTTRVVSFVSQYPPALVAIPRTGLRLSWTAEGPSGRQTGYRIAWHGAEDGLIDAVEGDDSIGVLAPGGPLGEEERREYRVSVATPSGWSPWSDALVVEGALDGGSLGATPIGRSEGVGGPAALLRTTVDVEAALVRATLRGTFFGVGEFRINGSRVGDDHLAPGWTAYQSRVVYSTWDVTDRLHEGENVLGAIVGDGWYRGRLGWTDGVEHYGTAMAALARLDLLFEDGTTRTLTTGPDWRTSTGAIRMNSLYDGVDADLRAEPVGWDAAGFDSSGWDAVSTPDIDTTVVEARSTTGVRVIGEWKAQVERRGETTRIDCGQNISGWLRLTVRGRAGDHVAVHHAEVLEPNGALHLRALRTARAADMYILGSDGIAELEPSLTFHGFRFADVVGAEVVSAIAVAISSADAPRSSFECSNPAVTQLHSNTVWSQRDNFVSLPTDCPQRDERLGWTGDAQAFASTASTLFDVESFWLSWLRDLEIDQDESGAVAAVVPNILGDFQFPSSSGPSSIMGRAGWADAATIVPWAVRNAYGSDEPLRQQLGSMRRWVEHLRARAGSDVVLPTEFQFGDWLDPDAPGDRPEQAKVSADFVANAFYAHSAHLLAEAERLVGDPGRARRAEELARLVADETWRKWGEDAVTTQTGAALALEFDIAPMSERDRIGTALGDLVRAAEGRIATGFLGTPLILHALVSAGRVGEAYLMLLRHEAPSWLYQVDQGATTIWERWDAVRPDGSIHDGDMAEGSGMLSFNHYAYGAVVDWLYRYVAGIGTSADRPGYRGILVAPRPAVGIEWARAHVDSRLGRVAIDWRIEDDEMTIDLSVPFGAVATLSLPTDELSTVEVNGGPRAGTLVAGQHRIVIRHPVVALAGRQ